jgi:hypothetical protein
MAISIMTIHHNGIQHYDNHQNGMQHNDNHHNGIQHNDTQQQGLFKTLNINDTQPK